MKQYLLRIAISSFPYSSPANPTLLAKPRFSPVYTVCWRCWRRCAACYSVCWRLRKRGGFCLLETSEVPEVPEVMRCALFCMLDVLEGAGSAGGDAQCATTWARFRGFEISTVAVFSLQSSTKCPDSEWTAYSLLKTAENRSQSAVGSCKVDSNKCAWPGLVFRRHKLKPREV